MLKNYLRSATRQLALNWRHTLINVLGLSLALACSVVAYLNHEFAYGFDSFHENADEIYRVNSIRTVSDQSQTWGISPMPLGPTLEAEFPFIDDAVRLSQSSAVVRFGENVFNEDVYFAEPGFFEMFTIPLRQGNADALGNPGEMIISPNAAEKYFEADNPVGEVMTLRFNEEERTFVVGGVTEEIPLNSSLQFDFLLPYETLRVFNEDMDSWGRWGLVTFVRSSNAAAMSTLSDRLSEQIAVQNSARPDWIISRFDFVPFADMYLTSNDVRNYVLMSAVHPAAVVSPAIIAVLLLLMACFNFMNTAIAFAGKRLREIGIRKVLGGERRGLIIQFMGESMLQCVIAFAVALFLAEIFAPAYSSLWPNLDLEISYADNLPLFGFLGGLLLLTSLIAGGYPAYYISGFSPVNVLKGRQQLIGLNRFSKGLLTFQLANAILVLLASVVFTLNARYQETADLGFEREHTLMIPLGDAERFASFRDALGQNPDITSVAGSRNHVAWSRFGAVVETLPSERGEPVKGETGLLLVGPEYPETMGLRLADGRFFDANREADFDDAVFVNQTFAREFGLDRAVGETVIIDSTRYAVIGLVEDYQTNGFWEPIESVAFRLTRPDQYIYLTASFRPDKLAQADEFVRETWKRLVPEEPYDGMLMKDRMAEAAQVNTGIRTTFMYIAFLAIIIAAAGLFSLMSLAISRRTKEIGIRKVLGATVSGIGLLVNREFIVMMAIAAVVATALGYFAMTALLDSIWAFHSGVGWVPPIAAIGAILLIALATVGHQVYRVATANPVDALRYE
jgi:putative ABC transport system permease protein